MFRKVIPIALLIALIGLSPIAGAQSRVEGANAPVAMSDEVTASVACTLTGGTASAAAVLLGAENFINVVAGGVVAPANAAILALGVIGVVFVNFCQIGKSLTPLYLYYTQDTQPTPETKAAAVEMQ